MQLRLNGNDRDFPELDSDPRLQRLIELLNLQADRIALERNGEIVPRATWNQVAVAAGDKLEIVQFVGGGSAIPASPGVRAR